MPSISAMGSSVMGAPETGEAQDAHEGADPKDSPTTIAGDDGVPAPDTTTGGGGHGFSSDKWGSYW
jgi:hypothetical protein